jgi:heat shock protein HslJ
MPEIAPLTLAALLLATPLAAQEVTFLCAGGGVSRVAFDDGSATLALDGADPAALEAAQSGSGFRYEGAAGVLTGKGDEITWAPTQGEALLCAEVPGGAALVGPVWEVVRFRSMSDEIGTLEVALPATVTVAFGAGGRAAFGLDCNRGTGGWTATPGDDAMRGGLRIGPVGVTRALCAGGDPMADRLARDLGDVASYMRDGAALHLALRADAGIWTLRARDEGP